MKAVILGGGYATRLFGKFNPKTYVPKGLLVTGNKPAINYGLDNIVKISEIDTVYIITNRENESRYKKWLKNFNNEKIKLILEHKSKPGKNLGVVASIHHILKTTGFQDSSIILAPDNVFEFDSRELVNFYHKMNDNNVVAAYDIKSKVMAREHGVLGLDFNFRVEKFKEKPFEPFSTLIGAFFYVLNKATLNIIDEWLNQVRGHPDRFGDFIEWTMKWHALYGYKFKGKWFDIGTSRSLKTARRYFKS